MHGRGDASPNAISPKWSSAPQRKEGPAMPSSLAMDGKGKLNVYAAAELGTGAIDRMSHRKWRETKQQLS